MNSRVELARELLSSCPSISYADYCKIADALMGGCNTNDILNMIEMKRWPGTYAWLAERLC